MKKHKGYKMFVGCLPSDISTQELQIVFSTYGHVTDIHVMTARSKSAHACAFICYAREESGEDAISVLDGVYKIRKGGEEILPLKVSWAESSGNSGSQGWGRTSNGRGKGYSHYRGSSGCWQRTSWQQASWQQASWKDWLKVNSWQHQDMWRRSQMWGDHVLSDGNYRATKCSPPLFPESRIFIGNLPSDVRDDALDYVFSCYGTVNKIDILAGHSKNGQACAFIEYSTAAEAETAIMTLDDKYEIRPGNGPIMVKHAGPSALCGGTL